MHQHIPSCNLYNKPNISVRPVEPCLLELKVNLLSIRAMCAGGAVLAALVSGRAAARFEDMPLQQAVAEVMAVLQAWFAPRGISVPEPLQVWPILKHENSGR